MGEHEAALDTHVVVADDRWDELETIKNSIKSELVERFGISHSTLEFEKSSEQHADATRFCSD
jgi:cobalt-zinc-cadmium efflux system protein